LDVAYGMYLLVTVLRHAFPSFESLDLGGALRIHGIGYGIEKTRAEAKGEGEIREANADTELRIHKFSCSPLQTQHKEHENGWMDLAALPGSKRSKEIFSYVS